MAVGGYEGVAVVEKHRAEQVAARGEEGGSDEEEGKSVSQRRG